MMTSLQKRDSIHQDQVKTYHLDKFILSSVMISLAIPLVTSTSLLDFNALQRAAFSVTSLFATVLLLITSSTKTCISLNGSFITISLGFPLVLILSSAVNGTLLLSYTDFFFLLQLFGFSYLCMLVINRIGMNSFLLASARIITIVLLVFVTAGLVQVLGVRLPFLPEFTAPGSFLASRPFAVEYLVAASPWLLIPLVSKISKTHRAINILVFIASISYLLLLRGRAGIVALVVGIGAFYLGQYITWDKSGSFVRSKIFKWSLALLVIPIGIGFIQIDDQSRKDLVQTIRQTVVLDEIDVDPRLRSWSSSMEMFYEKPILGQGTNSWAGLFPAYEGALYQDQNIYHAGYLNPHNTWFEYIAENGLVGLLFFLVLTLVIGFRLIQRMRKNPRYLYLLISFSGILTVSLFSFAKDRVAPMLILAMLMGIAFYQEDKASRLKIQVSRKSLSIVLVVILSMSSIFMVKAYSAQKIYISGIQHKFSGNYESAIADFNRINEVIFPVDINGTPVCYYAGVGYYELGDYQLALNNFQQAQTFSPYNPLILNNVASTAFQIGDQDLAEKTYLKIKTLFPNYYEPQINLLAMYTNNGQHESAIQHLNRLLADSDNIFAVNKGTLFKIKEYYDEFHSR